MIARGRVGPHGTECEERSPWGMRRFFWRRATRRRHMGIAFKHDGYSPLRRCSCSPAQGCDGFPDRSGFARRLRKRLTTTLHNQFRCGAYRLPPAEVYPR
jgi:hypothetical protein